MLQACLIMEAQPLPCSADPIFLCAFHRPFNVRVFLLQRNLCSIRFLLQKTTRALADHGLCIHPPPPNALHQTSVQLNKLEVALDVGMGLFSREKKTQNIALKEHPRQATPRYMGGSAVQF